MGPLPPNRSYVDSLELEYALSEHDKQLRAQYDTAIGIAMDKISSTELSMVDRLSRHIKWLIATVIAYSMITVTLNLSEKADQRATDDGQTKQILDAWKAIERSAAIVSEHSDSSRREFDENNDGIRLIRQETSSRIQQLEAEQRNHERKKEH